MSAVTVAEHYNSVREDGVGVRKESRIFYMRNMNNWIKSELINEILAKLHDDNIHMPRVMDLACGKGGDLRKWKIANVKSVVMTDIANVSLNQARERYEDMVRRDRHRIFPAEFILADCTKDDLTTMFSDSSPFDLVSCQFALHYSFIDEPSARMFLKNATQSLRRGGYFIGTLPDAERIVWAARHNNGEFRNTVCSVRYEDTEQLNAQPPLFGAMFHFTLDSQVNCPEFLAYFPLLQHLLEELDMELVFVRRFPEAIQHWLESGRGLMGRMQALEPYPASEGVKLSGMAFEYKGAAEFLKNMGTSSSSQIGTLSQSEWEAVCMYLVFAFKKKGRENMSIEESLDSKLDGTFARTVGSAESGISS